MFKKRLLDLCNSSKKWIAMTVLMNWISIICNILIILFIGNTIDKLINSNIHIESITDLIDTKIVEIVIMDVNNSQNINRIIDGIIMSCIAVKDIFKRDNIAFRFKIIMWDDAAKKNVKFTLAKKSSKEEYNYIRSRLSTYKVDGRNVLLDLKLDINAIKIRIENLLRKIENAKKYIEEIEKHQKSIFDFWKFTNKDKIEELPEPGEKGKRIKKVFNYIMSILRKNI